MGRNGAETGLRLDVIPGPAVGVVTGDPVPPAGALLFPIALLRLVGLLAKPLPTVVVTGAVFVSTVAAAVTVGPVTSGAASSSLNWGEI